ncbi:hypothetical protein [Paraburkholderia sp. SIMBA_054]|uniref:hypothetical protein n=1 Tax=Paraburkholderia sp. SIMBA_054 TaxID=3085795 RepID=UPI0039786226
MNTPYTASAKVRDPITSGGAMRLIARMQEVMQQGLIELATVWLVAADDSTVRLEQLWSDRRRIGAGTAILKLLSSLADIERVTLSLSAHRLLYNTDDASLETAEVDRLDKLNALALDNEGLVAWYKRHGFEETAARDGDDAVLTRQPSSHMSGEGIAREVSDALLRLMKSGAVELDAFRYEMFARRIIAAEYGRPDAVTWALDWYRDSRFEEASRTVADCLSIHRRALERERSRAEFDAGRVSNWIYQAFLDTIDVPAAVRNNAPYMAWNSALHSRFDKLYPRFDRKGKETHSPEEREALWRDFVKATRDEQLSDRVRLAEAQAAALAAAS